MASIDLCSLSLLLQINKNNHTIILSELQELRKDGFDLAVIRYRELKPILDEVILLLSLVRWVYVHSLPELAQGLNNFLVVLALQLAILEAEQKAEEEEGPETSSRKRGTKKKSTSLLIK